MTVKCNKKSYPALEQLTPYTQICVLDLEHDGKCEDKYGFKFEP